MPWRLAFAVVIVCATQRAYADEDHRHHHEPASGEPRFVECDPKAVKPTPCHVHDPRTAGKMAPHSPALKDPHARQEYEAWRAGRFPQMY